MLSRAGNMLYAKLSQMSASIRLNIWTSSKFPSCFLSFYEFMLSRTGHTLDAKLSQCL